MALLPDVHWSEGLFLRPQHLQLLQRGLREAISAERFRTRPFAYGVMSAVLSRGALSNFEVRFEELRAIMPSGLEVDAPDRARLPHLDIKKAMESDGHATVLLGVPRWERRKANTAEELESGEDGNGRPTSRYRVTRLPVTDENTGVDEQDVDVRLVNALLLLEGDADAGLETIPVLKVKWSERADTPAPEQDPEYIPPCLAVGGSGNLNRELRAIQSSLSGAWSGLGDELRRGGYAPQKLSGATVDLQLRHIIVSGASARLKAMLAIGELAPFDYYIYLCELIAELEALDPERATVEPPLYDHHNLAATFGTLRERAAMALTRSTGSSFIERHFEPRDGNLVTVLQQDDVTSEKQLYLKIDSPRPVEEVRAAVENRNAFKLVPASWLGDTHKRFNFGLKLQYDPHPPDALPAPTRSMLYFRLDRMDRASTPVWRDLQSTEGDVEMAIMWVPPAVFDCRAPLCRELTSG